MNQNDLQEIVDVHKTIQKTIQKSIYIPNTRVEFSIPYKPYTKQSLFDDFIDSVGDFLFIQNRTKNTPKTWFEKLIEPVSKLLFGNLTNVCKY